MRAHDVIIDRHTPESTVAAEVAAVQFAAAFYPGILYAGSLFRLERRSTSRLSARTLGTHRQRSTGVDYGRVDIRHARHADELQLPSLSA